MPIEYRYLFEACVSIFTARTEAFLIEAEEEMVRYEEEERYDEVIRKASKPDIVRGFMPGLRAALRV